MSVRHSVDVVAIHAIHRSRQPVLGVDADVGAGVCRALLGALLGTARVERQCDGHVEPVGCGRGRQTGHPEVGVDHVGPCAAPLAQQIVGELAHVGQQLVLVDRGGWAGVDVVDDDARGELDPPVERRVVASCVHDDIGTQLRESDRQRGDVDVLSSGVDTADQRERARMFGHEMNPQRHASSRSRFQWDKKRSSENRSSAC